MIFDPLPEGQEVGAIAIKRLDLLTVELRVAAAKCRDAHSARRMLAAALVLENVERKTVTDTGGMDRQTLRDWVHRYDAEGLAALSNPCGPPRSRRLDPEQVATLVSWLEAGPDPAVDGMVRWRRHDMRARIASAFGVELHEMTVEMHFEEDEEKITARPCYKTFI